MKRLLALLAACLAVPAAAQNLAVVHAEAWTMTADVPVPDATIVIRGGRIVSVAAGGAVPAGLVTLDAAGRRVTPGLISGATQIGLLEVAGAEDTADEAVTSGHLGAAFDVAPAVNANSLLIQQARADGIVWAMSLPSGSPVSPFMGQGALLRLGGGNDIVERPRAAMVVRIGGSAASSAGGSRAAQWTLLRTALDETRALAAGRTAAAADRLFSLIDLNALRPILDGRTPLAIQTHRASDIREAIRIARDYGVKVVIVGGAEAWTLADELAAARIAVILDPIANLPMSHDEVGARLDNAAILERAGVRLGVTLTSNSIDASYNVGTASRGAAGVAVANGLSYSAALRALTSGPAAIWGVADRTGSLAPGKAGDLVIWDGDPLEPSSAPTNVVVAGREMPIRTRQMDLTDRYAPRRRDDPWPPAYR